MFDERRTINDLIIRYELEPSLKDIFVEGLFDKEILGQYAKSHEHNDISFYEIDSVDVPHDLLKKYHLTDGNKQRVIALANELEILGESSKVFCLVDKDLDHFFEEIKDKGRLRWSIFCSIEGHYLSEQTITDIIFTLGKAKIIDSQAFMRSLEITLKKLYALRLSDRKLSLNLNWVALKKYLKKKGDEVDFNHNSYINSLLNANSKMQYLADFKKEFEDWILKVNCDIRDCSRGHDYTQILAWSIEAFGGQKEFSTSAAIERLFVLLARSVKTLSNEILREVRVSHI
ncbi:MAG: hypothetical protein KIG98_02430 [Comamonas sp.]|nr:hypothetical protein [Comamonas sp.]